MKKIRIIKRKRDEKEEINYNNNLIDNYLMIQRVERVKNLRELVL